MTDIPEDVPEDVWVLAEDAWLTLGGCKGRDQEIAHLAGLVLADRRSRDATAGKMAAALHNIQVRLSESSLKPSHEVHSVIEWCDDEARLALNAYKGEGE